MFQDWFFIRFKVVSPARHNKVWEKFNRCQIRQVQRLRNNYRIIFCGLSSNRHIQVFLFEHIEEFQDNKICYAFNLEKISNNPPKLFLLMVNFIAYIFDLKSNYPVRSKKRTPRGTSKRPILIMTRLSTHCRSVFLFVYVLNLFHKASSKRPKCLHPKIYPPALIFFK